MSSLLGNTVKDALTQDLALHKAGLKTGIDTFSYTLEFPHEASKSKTLT